jgi:hypothetical protein
MATSTDLTDDHRGVYQPAAEEGEPRIFGRGRELCPRTFKTIKK